jgi:hypothetical protein
MRVIPSEFNQALYPFEVWVPLVFTAEPGAWTPLSGVCW